MGGQFKFHSLWHCGTLHLIRSQSEIQFCVWFVSFFSHSISFLLFVVVAVHFFSTKSLIFSFYRSIHSMVHVFFRVCDLIFLHFALIGRVYILFFLCSIFVSVMPRHQTVKSKLRCQLIIKCAPVLAHVELTKAHCTP